MKIAAGVVILRLKGDSYEILMLKRRSGRAFGNTYAVPGGVHDLSDSDERWFSLLGVDKEMQEATQYSYNIDLTAAILVW